MVKQHQLTLFLQVFLVALAIRLVHLLYVLMTDPAAPFFGDGAMYWKMGGDWLLSGEFSRIRPDGTLNPISERLPGYPLFVLLFRWMSGDTVVPLLVFQCFVDSATCVVIARLAAASNTGLAGIAGFLAAAWPNLILHSAAVLTETIFLFFFVSGLYLLLVAARESRVRTALLAGALLGAAVAFRSVAVLPLLVCGALIALLGWAKGASLLRGLLLAMAVWSAATVVIAPMVARNIVVFDSVGLTSQAGNHFLRWVYPAIAAQGGDTDYNAAIAFADARLQERIASENIDWPTISRFERSRFESGLAVDLILEQPMGAITRAFVSGAIVNLAAPSLLTHPIVSSLPKPSFTEDTRGNLWDRIGRLVEGSDNRYLLILAISLPVAAIVSLMQAAGAVLWLRNHPLYGALGLALILYFLIVTGVVTSPKYRLPIEPVLIVMTAYTIRRLLFRKTWGARP